MADGRIRQIADDAVEMAVETASDAQRLAQILRHEHVGREVVAGLASVSVLFHPLETNADAVTSALRRASQNFLGEEKEAAEPLDVPVHYGGKDGPDFSSVCEQLDLTEAAFISMHTAGDHAIDMIGFTPGFAYVSGLSASISIPRLGAPRARVPAGSIGISSNYTGIYALAGPGGWPLIGRTDMTLFDAKARTPFRLHPGQRLRFVAA